MSDDRSNAGAITCASAYAIRAALLLVLWWAFTEATGGWSFGVPLAALAAAVSLWLTPPARHVPRLRRLPAFAAYFLLQSLRAGWDVARRTLHPRLPLRPGLLRLPARLPDGAPTWWLMITLSLLPGTLSVRLDGRTLEVHCLDAGSDAAADVHAAQIQLAALFGAPLADEEEA
jgi:multicomponent Na+:H+ antiporter subunit E